MKKDYAHIVSVFGASLCLPRGSAVASSSFTTLVHFCQGIRERRFRLGGASLGCI